MNAKGLLTALVATGGVFIAQFGFAATVTIEIDYDAPGSNLVELYKRAARAGPIATKLISLREGETPVDALVRDNVLFAAVQACGISALLRDLNKAEGQVSIAPASKANPCPAPVAKPEFKDNAAIAAPHMRIRLVDSETPFKVTAEIRLDDLLKGYGGFRLTRDEWYQDPGFLRRLRVLNPQLQITDDSSDAVRSLKVGSALRVPGHRIRADVEQIVAIRHDYPVVSTMPQLFWNVWASTPAAPNATRGVRVTALDSGSRYSMSVHLAPVQYGPNRGSNTVIAPMQGLAEMYERAAKPGNALKLAVIPDPDVFSTPPFEVSLGLNHPKVDEFSKAGMTVLRGSVFADAPALEGRKYSLASSNFDLAVRDQKDGYKARVSFVVLDGNHPVDEFSFTWCVAECTLGQGVSLARSRSDLLLEGLLLPKEEQPEVLLLVLEEPEDDSNQYGVVVGMVRTSRVRNLCGEEPLCAWEGPGASVYKQDLENFLTRLDGQDNLETVGKHTSHMMETIFYGGTDGTASGAARKALNDYLGSRIGELLRNAGKAGAPPLMMVRTAPIDRDEVMVFPVGMLPIWDRQGNMWVAGQFYRIVSPFPGLAPSAAGSCAEQWTTLMPAEGVGDPAMNDALVAMGEGIRADWRRRSSLPTAKDSDSLDAFSRRFGEARKSYSTTLMLLGHHYKGTLGFDTSQTGPVSYVSGAGIATRFDNSSIAVINGCSTSSSAGTNFVTRLARQGMGAVIATSSKVFGAMAGAYFRCFEQALDGNGNARQLSQVHYDAIACLFVDGKDKGRGKEQVRTWQDGIWSVNAFRYVLFGNGNVRVCKPN